MSEIHGSAAFSDCREHRHVLSRWWSEEPRALVCGCNPSRADGERTDPTVCRIIALLRGRPGIGGFDLVNFHDRIETDPEAFHLWRARAFSVDPDEYDRGRQANLVRIRKLTAGAAVRILAWGDLVPVERQSSEVVEAMSLDGTHDLHAFALTKAGRPRHPLARGRERIPLGAPLVVWRRGRRAAA